MVEIIWTKYVIEEIESIAEYIAKDSLRYAEIVVQRFFDSAELLKTHPRTGRKIPEYNKEGYRQIIVGNYRVIYRIVSVDKIVIITVHHGARKLDVKKIKARK